MSGAGAANGLFYTKKKYYKKIHMKYKKDKFTQIKALLTLLHQATAF